MKNMTKKEYNQISKKELLENDKILIINKFGFSPIFKKTNSAQNQKCNQLNLNPNLTLSSIQIQSNNKKKNLIQSNSTLLLTKKEGRNYHQYKPSITNASTTTNFYSSFYNSKNKLNLNNKSSNNIKKEKNIINSCLWNKLIKNIDQNQNNKINNMKKQISNNTNEINNSSITKTEKEDNTSKNKIKHVIKIQKSNPVKLKEIKSFVNNVTENKSSNYENNDEYKKSNANNNTNNILDEFSDSEKEKNNILIKNKNYFYENKIININNNNFNNNHKNEKYMFKFVSRNNIYDISSRDIKEEKSLMKFFYKEKEADYLFISEIEKKNKNIANLNIKKFVNLSDKSIYNILSFRPEIYSELINSNKLIKKRINLCLENIYLPAINDFKIKYKNLLSIIKYSFIQKKINSFNSDNNYILDLILQCKIITKKIKLSIEISCNYFSNKEKYDYVWIFDIQKKSSIKKWISSEINTSRNFQKNQAISYSSQISPFSYEDEIQIPINIFNIKNGVNPYSLEWCEPIISYVEPEIYEKTKFINKINFDPLRACEVEMQILYWSLNLSEKQNILVNEVKKFFENFFLIKNIWANSCKYDFYKLEMTPIKKGLLSKNKFCSFDICIVDEDAPTKNEIQCIYFLNTNSFSNKMDIKLGNDLILYIIDMKVI